MWDTISFVIGLLLGMVLMLILAWGAFRTRTFVFEGCINTDIQCRAQNYYNDPGMAIKNEGAVANQILAVVNDKLFYRRVRKDLCRPGPNQDIHILNPQVCLFQNSDGTSFQGKNNFYESPHYIGTSNGSSIDITTNGDCNPVNSSSGRVVSGKPLALWTPY